MPAFGAIVVALFAFAMMRDTPQSCGLPPIEEYKNDYPDDYNEKAEEELTAKQIFMQYVLPNKLLWYIAIANVFVYLLRYGILDWSPTYLKEVKHFALDKSSWAYFLYEYAGIPGTLLCGWMSDQVRALPVCLVTWAVLSLQAPLWVIPLTSSVGMAALW